VIETLCTHLQHVATTPRVRMTSTCSRLLRAVLRARRSSLVQYSSIDNLPLVRNALAITHQDCSCRRWGVGDRFSTLRVEGMRDVLLPTTGSSVEERPRHFDMARHCDPDVSLARLTEVSRNGSYDAVVVGAGPNGLAAAIALARAGYSVLVREARDTCGGSARSAELTLPGFKHDICSAVYPLAAGSPFFRTLPLSALGLKWVHPQAPLAHPLDDGSAVVLHRSLNLTGQGLGADGAAYQRPWSGSNSIRRCCANAATPRWRSRMRASWRRSFWAPCSHSCSIRACRRATSRSPDSRSSSASRCR